MRTVLIADSGSTKAEWCLLRGKEEQRLHTVGLSPYFLTRPEIEGLVRSGVADEIEADVEEVHFYGTGCADPENAASMKAALKTVFKGAKVEVQTDLVASARALLGREKGIACILGTGSNSGYYNGTRILRNSPGLGYVLGDEGSGAYLGRKVIQYYLYGTFDEDMRAAFDARFGMGRNEILNGVYRQPLANRFLASFAIFLAENRGHFMVENIIEDGLNDFFFQHLSKYREVWLHPVSFVGSVAHGFRDVLDALCQSYGFSLGEVLRTPMPGLVRYHQ